jgi:hypothetical protein
VSRFALTAVTAAGLVLSTSIVPATAAEGDATFLNVAVSTLLTLPEGDGFNDSTVVTLTADAAITAQPVILDSADAPVGPELTPVELIDPDADGTFSEIITLSGLGLAAGAYTVSATEVVGETLTGSAPLVVGSGSAVSVTVSSATTFYPRKDGYLDALTATVTATDETGTAVPYTGAVGFTSGSVKRTAAVASTTGAAASASVPVTGLPAGTGSLVAKVRGRTGVDKTSAARTITLALTQVNRVALTKAATTIYPAKDGYHDTGVFKFTAAYGGPSNMPVTGSVTILLGGKKVKSWTLSSTAAKTFTWDGLYGGKIVPGKYTVRAGARGPEGTTKSAEIYVNVSSKKLVNKTASRTVNAKPVLKEYVALDELQLGECWYTPEEVVGCDGYEGDESGLSLWAFGSIPVPTDVRTAYAATVRLTANVDYVDGSAGWTYYFGDAEGPGGDLVLGNNTLAWLTVDKAQSKVNVDFGLLEHSSVDIDYYKIEWRYKVLQ